MRRGRGAQIMWTAFIRFSITSPLSNFTLTSAIDVCVHQLWYPIFGVAARRTTRAVVYAELSSQN
jgi:hypothetical protein